MDVILAVALTVGIVASVFALQFVPRHLRVRRHERALETSLRDAGVTGFAHAVGHHPRGAGRNAALAIEVAGATSTQDAERPLSLEELIRWAPRQAVTVWHVGDRYVVRNERGEKVVTTGRATDDVTSECPFCDEGDLDADGFEQHLVEVHRDPVHPTEIRARARGPRSGAYAALSTTAAVIAFAVSLLRLFLPTHQTSSSTGPSLPRPKIASIDVCSKLDPATVGAAVGQAVTATGSNGTCLYDGGGATVAVVVVDETDVSFEIAQATAGMQPLDGVDGAFVGASPGGQQDLGTQMVIRRGQRTISITVLPAPEPPAATSLARAAVADLS